MFLTSFFSARQFSRESKDKKRRYKNDEAKNEKAKPPCTNPSGITGSQMYSIKLEPNNHEILLNYSVIIVLET